MSSKLWKLLCCLTLFPVLGYSQIDTLVVRFNSDYEKELILLSLKTEGNILENYIPLLFSIDSSFNKKEVLEKKKQIDSFIETLQKKTVRYSPKKKVKYIFNKTHDVFFNKYELESIFSDVFKTKTYNCVSGSALYAYILEMLEVPFQVKETPTHVFLVAYPSTYNIYLETTVPGKGGSYVPSETIIKRSVDELISLKLITSEYLTSVGYNKAYNEYFYGDGNIKMTELIGIQYYNKAIFEFNNKDYQLAYSYIKKSKNFYKNEKVNLFEKALLAAVIDEVDFKNINNFNWFIRYISDIEEIDENHIKYKFFQIIDEVSWTDIEYSIIENKINSIEDEKVLNLLLETYYSYRAEKYSKLLLPKKVLEYAIKVYEINNKDLNAKNYIVETKINALANKNVNKSRLVELEEIVDDYPFVPDFGIYNRYRIYLYSLLTSISFHKNESTKGFLYVKELERLIEDQQDKINFNHGAVGEAYGALGAYYYRKHKEEKAIEYLKRGLNFSPENENIERKLRLIKKSH